MDPNQQNQPYGQPYPPNSPAPLPPNQPQVFGPAQGPSIPNVPSSGPPLHTQPQPSKKPKFKKLAILGGILLGLLIVSAAVILAISGADKKPKPNTAEETAKSQGPQPANAIGIEETNNSINQDISGQDHNKNFPATELDDKSLSL